MATAKKKGKCAGAAKHREAQKRYVGKNKAKHAAAVKRSAAKNKSKIAARKKAAGKKGGPTRRTLGRPRVC